MSKRQAKDEIDTSKKTANGLGSIDQLPSGLWRWRVTLKQAGGTQKRVSGTEKTETLAKKALNKAVTDNERSLLAATDRITVNDFAVKWLNALPGIQAATRHDYASELAHALEIPKAERKNDKDVISAFGKMRLRDVRPTDVQTLLKNLSARVMQGGSARGKTMSTRTLNMVRARLRSVFDQAIMDGTIYRNPMMGTKRAKDDRDEEDVPGTALDFAQSTRLHELGNALYAAGVARLWPAVFVALAIGLRRGEVMGLRWRDVNFGSSTISVKQNITELDGVPTLGKPKTKRSIRDIPMPSSLKTVLEAHRDQQARECKTVGRAWSNTGPVFATITGEYTAPSHLYRSLKSILEWSNPGVVERKETDPKKKESAPIRFLPLEVRLQAIHRDHQAGLEAIVRAGEKLPDIRVHDLRHTAGTQMLRRNMPIETVSRILGHASISITYDVYRHVSEAEVRLEMVDLYDAPLPVRNVAQLVMN